MFRLIITRDKDKVNETFFVQSEVTIGRRRDNDVCLHDSTVSGHHARLMIEGEAPVLEDLGSTNGTYVNGKRVGRCRLSGAEVIVIGKHTLQFQSLAAPMESEQRDPTQQLSRRELDKLLASALHDRPRSVGAKSATAKTLNWIAQDGHGTWWGFENPPEMNGDGWVDPRGGICIRLKEEPPGQSWQDSLHRI